MHRTLSNLGSLGGAFTKTSQAMHFHLIFFQKLLHTGKQSSASTVGLDKLITSFKKRNAYLHFQDRSCLEGDTGIGRGEPHR